MINRDQIAYLFPTAVRVLNGKVAQPENLLLKKDLQACDYEPNGTTVTGPCALLLDFGKELCGGVRIICECANKVGSKVHLVFGESVAEAMSDVADSTATNDHSARDFEAPSTMLSDVSYGQTGFRYVRVEFPEAEYQVKLVAIVAVSVTTAQQIEGSFQCNDALLNQIYDTAVRTVYLCLQNTYLWDGIKRDRIVWLGDMNPEIKALNTMFTRCSNVEKSLAFVLRHTPPGGWINNIPAYSMWWIINLRDYCCHTADRHLIETYFDEVRAILELFVRAGKQNWNFAAVSHTEMPWYLDWPTYGSEDSQMGVMALLKLALQAAKDLCLLVGKTMPETEELEPMLPTCIYRGKYKQIMALCALAGDVSVETAADMIAENGAEGFSTFQSYYMLKVMALGGRLPEAIDCVKSYFGAMLKMGATTFWEDFDIHWAEEASPITEEKQPEKPHIHQDFGKHCYVGLRHSLCHGWASGVAAFLTEYVLGVRENPDGSPDIQQCTGLPLAAHGNVPANVGTIMVERDAMGNLLKVQNA